MLEPLLEILLSVLFSPALVIIGIVVIIWLVRRSRRRTSQMEADERFARLENRVAALGSDVEATAARVDELAARVARPGFQPAAPAETAPLPAAPPTVAPAAYEAPAVREAEAPPAAVVERAPPTAPAPLAAPAPEAAAERAPPAAPSGFRRVERVLLENWTGILGAVAVVAGVTFVGIYTALKLAPVYRFLMTLAVGAALLAAAVVLGRRDAWRAFASWLRSAGAAIVLFACAAAGGLPGLGLQWVSVPLPALALLIAGIGTNLAIAYLGAEQVFAALHVVLSLVPLAIVSPSTVSLAIASAVALFGVTIGVRGRWDRHLAVVTASYLVWHVIWYSRMGPALDPHGVRLIALGCAVLVFAAVALAAHRPVFGPGAAPALRAAVHVAAFALLAIAVYVYLPDPRIRGAVLLALAAATYVLGRRARTAGAGWLHRADTLAAEGFVLLALPAAFDFGAHLPLVLLIAFTETLAFRLIVPRGADALLDLVTDALPPIAALLLLISGFLAASGEARQTAALLVGGAAVAVWGQRVLRTPPAAPPGSVALLPSGTAIPSAGPLLGLLAGLLVVATPIVLLGTRAVELVALVAGGALLVADRRLRTAGLALGVLVAVAGAHLVSWYDIIDHCSLPLLELGLRLSPLALLAVLAIVLAGPGVIRQTAIVLLGTDLGLAAQVLFAPVSPLIPGVLWLMLSLAALEAADRVPRRESLAALGTGYAYLVAFAVAYAYVIVQSPAYVGPVRARLLIELFAVAIFAYWWFYRPRADLAGRRSWGRVHPWFLEVILIAGAVCVIAEVPSEWWAAVWALMALALMAPLAERLFDARVRLYGLLFYWVSVVDMAVVLSVLQVPSWLWYERPQVTSLFAIALQVVYVVLARRLSLAALTTPPPWAWLARLAERVGRRRNLYVYHPMFAGIAIFLYWRFERSVLTLLWALEAFVVFALSAYLRENQFRYVALAGLGGCLVRLVVVDMAEANLAVRGIVFIGVGSLMLGMNAIYNRFRARFES